jgi:hypothetical protein
MSDGHGKARFRAELVRADTTEIIRRSKDFLVDFVDRHRSVLVAIRLEKVVLPRPGHYLVELFCEGVFVDDRRITVVSPEE